MKTIERKLVEMINNSYQYRGKLVTIVDYKINDGSVKLFLSDDDEIIFPFSDAVMHLASFTPAPQLALLQNNKVVVDLIKQSNGIYEKLQNTLMDSIEKVKTDPNYIPQAEAINSNVKSMLDIEKTRIAALSLLTGK